MLDGANSPACRRGHAAAAIMAALSVERARAIGTARMDPALQHFAEAFFPGAAEHPARWLVDEQASPVRIERPNAGPDRVHGSGQFFRAPGFRIQGAGITGAAVRARFFPGLNGVKSL